MYMPQNWVFPRLSRWRLLDKLVQVYIYRVYIAYVAWYHGGVEWVQHMHSWVSLFCAYISLPPVSHRSQFGPIFFYLFILYTHTHTLIEELMDKVC